MIPVKAYAAPAAKAPLGPHQFKRRDPGPSDVMIDLLFCGICHSDIHSVRDEWGAQPYPLTPGHEMLGKVSAVGAAVKKFKVGDRAAVGCLVNSCRDCVQCRRGLEQFCEKGPVFTYGATDRDGTITQGGYSSVIVVDEHFVFRVPDNLPLERAAPLLCAGITTYSPLRHWNAGPGTRVGVVGLGGLGHMAVKLAASLGAEVTVFSTSKSKAAEAGRLGAHRFVSTKEDGMSGAGGLDLILDTVSAPHPLENYLPLLRPDGTLVLLGASPEPLTLPAFSIIMGRRAVSGSLIGGVPETQEMLDFCAAKNVAADVEVIPPSEINRAYERVIAGDVRYRFVIDLGKL